jgi:hypothetical protein
LNLKLALGVFSGFDYICHMWRVADGLRAPFFSDATLLKARFSKKLV